MKIEGHLNIIEQELKSLRVRLKDSVEVVRCKDCKFWAETLTKEEREACCIEDDMVCSYWMSDGLTKQDFCSFGERRKDG